MAAAKSAGTNRPVPGVAQGGIQMGHYAGNIIYNETAGRATSVARAPFEYWDKGSMAVIGKNKAVAQIGPLKIGGFVAWLMWGGVHILFLVGFRNRLTVMISWIWNWLINARDARLITGDAHLAVKTLPGEILVPSPGTPGEG